MRNTNHSASPAKAWFITGPTSGIGHRTALQLAKHGSVVLVGRDPNKLRFKARSTRSPPAARYRSSATSPTFQVRGARPQRSSPSIFRSPACSTTRASCRAVPSGPRTDGTIAFATNQLGPFASRRRSCPICLTTRTSCSSVRAPRIPPRKPAVAAGFRGGRYVSAEASARGEWKPGGSSKPGFDAYATSKQCNLATVLAFARTTPRLRFNAVEPGFNPGTGLGRDVNVALRFLAKYVLSPLAPFIKYWSTPSRAAHVITEVLTDTSDRTGVYYDENVKPMAGSAQVRDPAFADRIVAETRELLATIPMDTAPIGL